MEHGWPQTETMKTKRGVEGTTVILCLSAWGTPQLFSLAATSLYIPISNAWSIYVQEDVIIFVYVKPPLHCKDNSNVVTYMFFRCNWFIVLMASVIDLPPGCSIHYWKCIEYWSVQLLLKNCFSLQLSILLHIFGLCC